LKGVDRVAKREVPRPTDAELAILRVLWQEGPATVRRVRDVLDRTQPTGYTTVLKLLQIMTEKGLVERDESRRTHVYRPSRGEEQTQQHLVGDLLGRAFGGSASKLVMQALAVRRATAEELAEIRKLIETLEEQQKGGAP
jgi:BlaI family transcriptional regulator, penicillinase repressor